MKAKMTFSDDVIWEVKERNSKGSDIETTISWEGPSGRTDNWNPPILPSNIDIIVWLEFWSNSQRKRGKEKRKEVKRTTFSNETPFFLLLSSLVSSYCVLLRDSSHFFNRKQEEKKGVPQTSSNGKKSFCKILQFSKLIRSCTIFSVSDISLLRGSSSCCFSFLILCLILEMCFCLQEEGEGGQKRTRVEISFSLPRVSNFTFYTLVTDCTKSVRLSCLVIHESSCLSSCFTWKIIPSSFSSLKQSISFRCCVTPFPSDCFISFGVILLLLTVILLLHQTR